MKRFLILTLFLLRKKPNISIVLTVTSLGPNPFPIHREIFDTCVGRTFGCSLERILNFDTYGDTGFIIENCTTATEGNQK